MPPILKILIFYSLTVDFRSCSYELEPISNWKYHKIWRKQPTIQPPTPPNKQYTEEVIHNNEVQSCIGCLIRDALPNVRCGNDYGNQLCPLNFYCDKRDFRDDYGCCCAAPTKTAVPTTTIPPTPLPTITPLPPPPPTPITSPPPFPVPPQPIEVIKQAPRLCRNNVVTPSCQPCEGVSLCEPPALQVICIPYPCQGLCSAFYRSAETDEPISCIP